MIGQNSTTELGLQPSKTETLYPLNNNTPFSSPFLQSSFLFKKKKKLVVGMEPGLYAC
jgi:hypothetical protein